jgi:hypothetical protein
MPTVTISGQVDGDIEDGETPEEPAEYDYIDEYGTNNGPGIQIGETTWTPVNCGYHKDDFKYGKLYQWGRKYGQGYEGDLYDVNDNKSGTYSDATVPAIEEGGISVVLVHIPKQFLGYSFQLPATAATLATMPTFEVTSATIGLQGRTIPTPAASASTAEMSAWASTAAVRTGTLSVAFRQPTKSLSFSGE